MSLHVHLIRHGETEWSLSGQHTSSTEVVLTNHGEGQARSLGERLPVINAENLPLGTASLRVLGFAANHPELPVIGLLNSS